MILNEKLVEDASGVGFVEMGGVDPQAQDRVRDGMRAAISHYLANRSLPDRMREAAETLRDANQRLGYASDDDWGVLDIEDIANRFEQEDRAQAERHMLVEELACALYRKLRWSGCGGSDWSVVPEDSPTKAQFREAARLALDITRREVS